MTCPHCNRWGEECKPAQCEGCGTWQCFSNGTGNGRCKVCLYGHLSGWSKGFMEGKGCGYKGCAREAVFFGVPRVKRCCAKCAPRVKIAIYAGAPPHERKRSSEPLDVYVRRMVETNARRYRRETYAEWVERNRGR